MGRYSVSQRLSNHEFFQCGSGSPLRVSVPSPMNLGIVEPHPERSSFVVERFSADLRAWCNGTTTALKRSTTNRRRFMVPMRPKKEWRLPVNLPRPLTCVLSPWERGGVRGIRFLGSIRDKFVVEPLPLRERCRVGCHSQHEENATRLGTADATPRRCLISSPFRGEDKGEGDFLLGAPYRGADCAAQAERRGGFRSTGVCRAWDSLPLPCDSLR